MAYNYNNREYEERLNRVFSRHPNVNVGEMMHNERLGFQPHEKRLIEEEIRYGRPPQEVGFLISITYYTSSEIYFYHFVALFENHR